MTRGFWLYFECDGCGAILKSTTPRPPSERGLLKLYGWEQSGTRRKGLERHRCPECAARITPSPFA